MKASWRTWRTLGSGVAALAAVAMSCQSSVSAPPKTPTSHVAGATLPAVATPWPAAVKACEVLGTDDTSTCEPGFDILRAPDSGDVVAHVGGAHGVQATWSGLPVVGHKPWAQVWVRGEGIRIGGWASLAPQRFETRVSVDFVSGHVWIPAGAKVSILGTTGSHVVISAVTPFLSPASVEVPVDCAALGHHETTVRVAAGPPYAVAVGGKVDLRDGPAGNVVFSFQAGSGSVWVWLGDQNGYVHIAGGQPPSQSALSDTPLVFDGWVDASTVKRADEFEEDRDSGCDMLDGRDACPNEVVVRNTSLYAGTLPGGEPVGTLERGTPVELGAHKDGFVAIATPNHIILPKPAQLFWVRETDVDKACGNTSDLDGCPPCP